MSKAPVATEEGSDIAPPEPDLTPDEMVARARDLVPMLVEQQAETEERSFYSEEIHQAFCDAGFYLATHPRKYGGYGFPSSAFFRIAAELCRGCPSTGWCYALGSGHTIAVAAYMEEEAQRGLLGNGHFICPTTLKPQGTARRADGGWVIDGTFNYCSGAPYATHFWGHAIPEQPPEDGGPPMPIQFICPRDGWTRLDDWGSSLGLRGSGSHSIRVDNAFIPDVYILNHASFLGLAPTDGQTYGARLHDNPVYNGSAFSWFITEGTAIAVGMARGALDAYADLMKTGYTPIPPVVPRAEDRDYQLWYGEALSKVEVAEAILDRSVRRLDELTEAAALTLDDELLLARLSREAVAAAWDAVSNYCFRTAGSSEVRAGTRTERIFRDMSQLHSHNGFVFMGEAVSRDLTRLRFGADVSPTERSVVAARAITSAGRTNGAP